MHFGLISTKDILKLWFSDAFLKMGFGLDDLQRPLPTPTFQ